MHNIHTHGRLDPYFELLLIPDYSVLYQARVRKRN